MNPYRDDTTLRYRIQLTKDLLRSTGAIRAGSIGYTQGPIDANTIANFNVFFEGGAKATIVLRGYFRVLESPLKTIFECSCNYCTSSAITVVHDRRGCVPCCDTHRDWRRTTSSLFGHQALCPFYIQEMTP